MRIKTKHPGVYYRVDAKGFRRYIVWFTDSEGRGRFETLPLGAKLENAVARQAELRNRRHRGAQIAVSKETVREYGERWLETATVGLKSETVGGYRRSLELHVFPRIGRAQLRNVSTSDVADMISAWAAEGQKAWTIRANLKPLGRMFSRAKRDGLVAANPIDGLERGERPKNDQREMTILSTEEIERLLAAADAHYRPFLQTLVFTGLRLSEALALDWKDIDFDEGTLLVRQAKTDAGAGRRVVLMPSLVRSLRLHRLASTHSLDDDPVFVTKIGTRPSRTGVASYTLDPAIKKSGVPRVTPHELRHTYASLLIGQGMDVTFVASQLGHSSPAITLQTYARLFDPESRRQEARDKLEAAFGGIV